MIHFDTIFFDKERIIFTVLDAKKKIRTLSQKGAKSQQNNCVVCVGVCRLRLKQIDTNLPQKDYTKKIDKSANL